MSKLKTFKTAQGVAQYPWLSQPDTQFDSAGQYKVNLKMSPEEAKPLLDTMKEVAAEAFGGKADKAHMPVKTDEETGDVVFVTKSKFKPKFADSSGAIIPEFNVPRINAGSELVLHGQIYPYSQGENRKGLSLQLGIVQIVSLSEGMGGSYDLDQIKGGFVAANDNAPQAEAVGGGYDF